jgi:hypothetical protein
VSITVFDVKVSDHRRERIEAASPLSDFRLNSGARNQIRNLNFGRREDPVLAILRRTLRESRGARLQRSLT